jgi:hypothetical protein
MFQVFAVAALSSSMPRLHRRGGGFFNSPTDYELTGTNSFQNNFCTADCVQFEVENGVFSGRSTTNFAEIYAFGNAPGLDGEMFGHLGKVSFNPQTDILSGVFGGKEQMVAFVGGKWFPYYWYTVKGTFSENLGTGAGSVNLTSETYIGTSPVPEPETFTMLVTGICSIAGLAVRKLRR